jgi:hypothetical protein
MVILLGCVGTLPDITCTLGGDAPEEETAWLWGGQHPGPKHHDARSQEGEEAEAEGSRVPGEVSRRPIRIYNTRRAIRVRLRLQLSISPA